MDLTHVELTFSNPYRPGAGHMPPHLAGREREYIEFDQIVEQRTILNNLILTGLRGVGKTVLLDTFKPRAVSNGWIWIGTDLSESASVSENTMAIRLLTDLSVATAGISVTVPADEPLGFGKPSGDVAQIPLGYGLLMS